MRIWSQFHERDGRRDGREEMTGAGQTGQASTLYTKNYMEFVQYARSALSSFRPSPPPRPPSHYSTHHHPIGHYFVLRFASLLPSFPSTGFCPPPSWRVAISKGSNQKRKTNTPAGPPTRPPHSAVSSPAPPDDQKINTNRFYIRPGQYAVPSGRRGHRGRRRRRRLLLLVDLGRRLLLRACYRSAPPPLSGEAVER